MVERLRRTRVTGPEVGDVLEYFDTDLRSANPLAFPGYQTQLDRLAGAESVVTGRTATHVFIRAAFDVLGGSMGVVHGERVVRAFDRAIALGLPVVMVTASGGARMQEGMVALIQMARTAAASKRHSDAGLQQIAWFDNPTTGGVFASYASLADVKAAPAGAYLGFGGPRVLEAFGVAPDESHSSESALAHGLIDEIVDESDRDRWVERQLAAAPESAETSSSSTFGTSSSQASAPSSSQAQTQVGAETSSSSTFGTSSSQASAPSISRADPWDIVRRARERRHPSGVEVAQRVCGAWHELKFSDPVFRIATAEVSGTAVVVIAGDRRAGTGRPTPASYRAAQRAMMLAVEKGVPVLTFVDMPGADPSPVSENAGIAREIARTFALMMTITVPTIAVCVGEGGSGGALAIACGDQFACCDDSFFSVIAPEGAAAILDRDRNNAPARAHDLRLTAPDLLDLGVTDAVLPAAAEISAVQVGALVEQAQPGDRQRRWDAATRRALAVEN